MLKDTKKGNKAKKCAQEIYGVYLLDTRKTSIKKLVVVGHFVYTTFLNMVASDLHALLAALSLPPSASAKFAAPPFFISPSSSF
jgi:hypothetical protein